MGKTVYRVGGVWSETANPPWATIAAADVVAAADRPGGERTDSTDRDRYVFLGGRVYEVSAAVAAELTAAGYGARFGIESAPPASGSGLANQAKDISTWVGNTPNGS